MSGYIKDSSSGLEYQLSIYEPGVGQAGAGTRTSGEDKGLLRWTALTLGLERSPFLVAAVESERASITSQIALQISLTAVVEKAAEQAAGAQAGEPASNAPGIVREAFREANRQVYAYAHRMQIGGQAAATGMIAVFDGRRFAAAKVGYYEGYLWRGGQMIPLYSDSGEQHVEQRAGILQRFIGANSQILVDLATVAVKEGDKLLLGAMSWPAAFLPEAASLLGEPVSLEAALLRLSNAAERCGMTGSGFERPVVRQARFLSLINIGRPVIPLTQIIER